MRNAKKPTREQRKFIKKAGLDTYVWYVQTETLTYIDVENIETKEVRRILKGDN